MENNSDSKSPHGAVVSYNARLGGVLFLFYLLLYVGFIYLTAFDRQRMADETTVGINLAVLYGLGLIAMAVVLAVVYLFLCRAEGDKP